MQASPEANPKVLIPIQRRRMKSERAFYSLLLCQLSYRAWVHMLRQDSNLRHINWIIFSKYLFLAIPSETYPANPVPWNVNATDPSTSDKAWSPGRSVYARPWTADKQSVPNRLPIVCCAVSIIYLPSALLTESHVIVTFLSTNGFVSVLAYVAYVTEGLENDSFLRSWMFLQIL